MNMFLEEEGSIMYMWSKSSLKSIEFFYRNLFFMFFF
mgnify:CR=1 FL=1